jgi:hypothetical protein
MPIDCTKAIWIVVTNFGDDDIFQHYDQHVRSGNPNPWNMDMSKLSKELKQELKRHFNVSQLP